MYYELRIIRLIARIFDSIRAGYPLSEKRDKLNSILKNLFE
ncbi:MAG: hypothetical protein VX942_04290 [Candidatus Thermoplasmatota archaeon]|nr:hypothetical protein [Candidatus Thermoplasmatota archaeon]